MRLERSSARKSSCRVSVFFSRKPVAQYVTCNRWTDHKGDTVNEFGGGGCGAETFGVVGRVGTFRNKGSNMSGDRKYVERTDRWER